MKIQVGEIYMSKVDNLRQPYPNKTNKYLLPCLNEYGATFINKLSNVFKIAVGVGDIVVSNRKIIYEKHIFILIDTIVIGNKHFINFLDYVKEQDYYQDDYVYHNIQKSVSHMVVLKIPEKFYSSLDQWYQGHYSSMYDLKTINEYFKKHPDVQKVFIKDHNYKIVFVDKINKKFNATIKPEDYTGELDFKPEESMEVFNSHLKKKQ